MLASRAWIFSSRSANDCCSVITASSLAGDSSSPKIFNESTSTLGSIPASTMRRANALSIMSSCYRSPGDSRVTGVYCNKAGPRGAPRPGRSGCFHRLRTELSPYGPSEQFEQHDDAILVAELDQPADHVLQRPCSHPHEFTEPQRLAGIEPVEPTSLLTLPKRGHDLRRHGSRLVPGADKIGDPNCRQDRAPAHRRAINAREKIARKQRPQHCLVTARMTDPRAIARQICGIALPQEVFKRPCLVMRPCVDSVPAHQGAASSAGCMAFGEMRNRLGARTQPAGRPLSSVEDSRRSKLACGVRVSVPMSPSG